MGRLLFPSSCNGIVAAAATGRRERLAPTSASAGVSVVESGRVEAALEATDSSEIRGEVLHELQRQKQKRQQSQETPPHELLLFLQPRNNSSTSWWAPAACVSARLQRWVGETVGALFTSKHQRQHRWRRLSSRGLLLRGRRSTSSNLWEAACAVFIAAAAAALQMAAYPTVHGGPSAASSATALTPAAKDIKVQSWLASSILQCSTSAVSFWSVCAAGGRLQQALGISCASILAKPLGLITVAVASNAAAAAAAAAGFACTRVQELHASSRNGRRGWFAAAKELQQETRGQWGGLLLQHHPRTYSVSTSTDTSSGKDLLRLVTAETLQGLLVFYLLGGRLFRLSPSSLISPGAFAERGLSLSASTGYASETERRVIKKIGLRFGCHTCGIRTRSTRWVADHQPPTAQVISYEKTTVGWVLGTIRRLLGGSKYWPQRLYPHCESCSLKQAVAVRKQTAATAAAVVSSAIPSQEVAAKLREKRSQLLQQKLIFRARSFRLWHLTGGIVSLIRCLDAL
ncbi:uncharacterized protein LOC34621995 [Cyclospora cayetanensis]|uniref:Uncharacterized protein LOC34621995 n=1 Tax=Cyclospora cayetanensis TaxID=88456 RepID=A0A6P6RV10_9EIME|nr:uncharacterized protein LOC34621995 [Cyclospora cayetanensis]